MAAQPAARRRAIEDALLDFQHAPDRHLTALRQPALLFDSLKDVLLIASERNPQEGAPPPAAPVVQAARFFVRTALLSPRANHYALLGLANDADAAAIKERYRVLMRLMHPDFAATANAHWPADAASRVNQAYEVLSSPGRRAAYDEEQAGRTPAPPPAPQPQSSSPGRTQARDPRPAVRRDSRQVLRWLATSFGAIGGLAMVGMWIGTSQDDKEMLVQRATTRVATALPAIAPVLPTLPANDAPAAAPSPIADASAPAAPIAVAVVAPDAPAVAALTAAAEQPPALAVATQAPPPAPAAAPTAHSAPASVPAPAPQGVVVAAAPALSPAAASVSSVIPSPTISQVQPLLTQLLAQIESGWGDNVIDAIPERAARRAASAQALARQIDTMLDGVRPVKVSQSDFRGEPRDGHLVVTGRVLLQVRDTSAPTRQIALTAEFDERNGSPVLTRLGLAQ